MLIQRKTNSRFQTLQTSILDSRKQQLAMKFNNNAAFILDELREFGEANNIQMTIDRKDSSQSCASLEIVDVH
jgi:hypothetical protein